MGMVQHIETAFPGCNDKAVSALVAGLEREYGRGAAEGLARQFLEAEEVDFRWDARSEERWLGLYEDPDEAEFELDRVPCRPGSNGGARRDAPCALTSEELGWRGVVGSASSLPLF